MIYNIEFPFDPDDYVSKLQNAYIVYSKKFMENYAKEIENYDLIKNEINKIIKNLPYDESRPISELTSIFVKKYYDIYKMKTDYNYLQMKRTLPRIFEKYLFLSISIKTPFFR